MRTLPTTPDSRRHMRLVGTLMIALAATLIGLPSVAAAQEEPASVITITQHDSADQPECLPSALILTRQIRNTAEYFELIVRASAPPCEPIVAKAAVYAMPGNGQAWPQNLKETKEFTISKAGTTTIRFDKTCDPVQFDVLTGATPPVISPEGEHHGPLLFPLDVETSYQHWGCNNTTTSTTSSTSTSTSTSTTVAVTTASTTPPSSTPSTTPTAPTTVLGISAVNPGGVENSNTGTPANNSSNGPSVKDSKLAYTGANSRGIALVGLTLAVAGIGLIVIARRRATA